MIKRLFVFFLLVCGGLFSSAQVKSVMFDSKDIITQDSSRAVSYAVFGKLSGDSLYTFKRFDFEGILLSTGSFKDDSLQVPHGKFIYYDWITPENNPLTYEYEINGKERYVQLTGSFTDGVKTGRWIAFYPNGTIKQVVTYKQGIVQGAYQLFSISGKLLVSGLYVLGKKNGTWTIDGGKQENEYVNDQLISTLKGKKLREKKAQSEKLN